MYPPYTPKIQNAHISIDQGFKTYLIDSLSFP